MKKIMLLMSLLFVISLMGCGQAPVDEGSDVLSDNADDVAQAEEVSDSVTEATDEEVEAELDEVFIAEEDDVDLGEMY